MTKRQMSKSAYEIVDFLKSHPNSSTEQIAAGICKSIKYVRNNIVRLREQKIVKRVSSRIPTYRANSDVGTRVTAAATVREQMDPIALDCSLLIQCVDNMVRTGARAC
ncbi:hypothetical protein G3O00_01675 [Burkholderia sp. Ac-20384]|uniref:hypothetical protein n=1 Tax=Burkholderia sp. Ac-20384 TaxID=2703902 RepID=UPI0019808613|nr:hypothetical protein [Burkholderia sp. Ac-20384]MBN3822327.1 hypothetical protein [Burkholderia sp. Ac-20384]